MTNVHTLQPAASRGFIARHWRSLVVLLTVLADLAAIACAAVAAVLLRNLVPNVSPPDTVVLARFTVYFAAVLISFGLLLGMYRGAFHLSHRRQYLLASRAYAFSLLVILSSFYVIRILSFFPRGFTFLFFLTLPFSFAVGRAFVDRLNARMQRKGYGVHRVLMAGYDADLGPLLSRFEQVPELGYEVCGVVRMRRSSKGVPIAADGRKVPIVALKDVESMVRTQSIDRIFVPSPSMRGGPFAPLLDLCRRHRIKLKVLSMEHDVLLRQAGVFDMAGISIYSPPRPMADARRRFVKRAFDLAGSLVLLLALSPVFLVTSLLIVIESGFPVFFTQRRASVRVGKTFGFLKFRSMVRNADELKMQLMPYNQSDGALFKMKDDPRVTRVGRFIRKYSIDELPQLLNVVRGEMSLVGPRPLPVSDFERHEGTQEFWDSIKDRERVKPGMTGLWQISGRSHIGFKEMMLLDLYYVENHSLFFDLEILFGTIPAVLFGKGAY